MTCHQAEDTPVNDTIEARLGRLEAESAHTHARLGELAVLPEIVLVVQECIIDLADEKNPRIVARFLNEVADPANCEKVINDFQRTTRGVERADPTYNVVAPAVGFQYDDHYCRPDRLHNPTILACGQIMSGLRVYDIRDPALDALAVIVRGADTGRPELAPEAPGLLALSHGLSANFPDDHAMLNHGLTMYDALYAWCRSRHSAAPSCAP